ncbi:type 1 fimbrial protein [Salmonella enterica]|nr:type 1 fimbrial protein [Salmonella enterica]EJC0345944.1 type 1 fimbrial protein [Salmonella enterica]EJC0669252.1 type 1 fimbrial protein [Salmonella enterica]
MSNLMMSLKAHKKGRHPERHRARARNALSTLLLSGVLATTALLLPGQAVAAKEASTTLTLKTRVTKATCNLTRNGLTPVGIQVIPLPSVNPGEVDHAGSGEWLGDIVPLNLGVRCSVVPEAGVGMSLVITPSQTDADYTGAAAIASTKSDGKAGPDLLIVNMDNSNAPVSFNPELATDGQSCSHSGQDCVKLNTTGAGASDWRLPLGVRVLIPVGSKRTDMLTPGTWQAAVTLNVAYQ